MHAHREQRAEKRHQGCGFSGQSCAATLLCYEVLDAGTECIWTGKNMIQAHRF